MGELFWGLAIGLGLLSLGGLGVFREFRRVRQVKAMPHTMATILDSAVREHSRGDDTTYSVYLLYRYTVNGVAHKAEQEIKSILNFSIWAAENLAGQYPAGRTDLPIAYNPLWPTQHQIADDRNVRLNIAWLVMCGIVLFFAIDMLFIVAFLVWPPY